jgi:hypothetical protein
MQWWKVSEGVTVTAGEIMMSPTAVSCEERFFSTTFRA